MSKAINEKIKELLKKKNITQIELASKLGKTQGAISEKLKSDFTFKPEELLIISEILGVDINYLYNINNPESNYLSSQTETQGISSYSIQLLKLKLQEMEIIQRNLEKEMSEKDKLIAEKDKQIAEKDKQIVEKEKEKEKQITEKEKQITEKETIIHEKSIIIADLRRDKKMLVEDKERLLAQINEGNPRKVSNG